MSKLHALALGVDRGGCGWYRVRQPFSSLKAMDDVEAHVVDLQDDDSMDVARAISVADVLVVRQGGEAGLPALRQLIDKFQGEAKIKKHFPKTILDIDDNVELISPYSEHYKSYGTEDFTTSEGVELWKHGKNGFNLFDNKKRVASLLTFMGQADLITVTTDKLAEYARDFNPNVAVLPNLVDTNKWWKMPRTGNKQLRVIWSGGISHYEDWYSIKEPLNKLMRKHQFKLISVGAHFGGVIDEDNKHLVEIMPWVPFEAHSYRMMCMRADIAMIPLADNPFNSYKSSIKFIEMSAMGLPSVVSNVTPYKEVIGDCALSYTTNEEFYNSLETLIQNEQMRENVGNRAYEMVQKSWDATKMAYLYKDAYLSILDK